MSANGASPAQHYLELVSSAEDKSHSAVKRTDHLVEDAVRHGLAQLPQDRLSGAMQQADTALSWLAAAERYHERVGNQVPDTAVSFAQQAARDLEMGTRALRRVSALVTDPDVDNDPDQRQNALSSLSLAQSHFRMADWELRNAISPQPDLGDGPEGLPAH